MKTENQILFLVPIGIIDWTNEIRLRTMFFLTSHRNPSVNSHSRATPEDFYHRWCFHWLRQLAQENKKIFHACKAAAAAMTLFLCSKFALDLHTHTLQKTYPRDMCCRSLCSFSISSCLAAFDVDEINGTPSRYHYRWWMDFTATLQPPSYKRGHPEGGSKTCTVKDPKRKQTILKDTKFKSMKIKENLTKKRKVQAGTSHSISGMKADF